MAAILEIPEVRQRVSCLSVEEYHRLGEYNERGRRTELIRGIIIEKMSKSPVHGYIGSLLYDRLVAHSDQSADVTISLTDPFSAASIIIVRQGICALHIHPPSRITGR